MTKLTNPHTLNTLREIGCLVNDKVDTSAIAALLAQRLEADHIAATADDIGTVETTVGQLATGLIGDEDPDFVDAIRPLLSASAGGRVQQALTNGYMLCARRATVQISIEGELVNQSISTRFLSADEDVIERYVLDPRVKRAESAARSAKQLAELVGTRQPDMAPRLTSFVERLNITWRRELGS